MMSKWALALSASLMGMAFSAQAAGGDVRASIGGGSFKVEPDYDYDYEADEVTTFDIRAAFKPTENVFLRGQYLMGSADKLEYAGYDYDTDLDINVLRLGAGYGGNAGSIRVYGALEYVDIEISVDNDEIGDDGVAFTGGIGDQGAGSWLWNVELSLIKLQDSNGASLEATLGYRFTPMFALVGGIQSYAFEDDYDAEYSYGQLHIGGQLSF